METLVKRNGFIPSVSTLFDDIFTRDIFDWTDKNFSTIGSNLPSVNLKETDNKLEVELASPGMKREYFKAEIDDDPLIIFSQKEEVIKKDNFIRKDFNYRSFCRLPSL